MKLRKVDLDMAALWRRLPAPLVQRVLDVWGELLPHVPHTPYEREYDDGLAWGQSELIGSMIPLLAVLNMEQVSGLLKAIRQAMIDGELPEQEGNGELKLLYVARSAGRTAAR